MTKFTNLNSTAAVLDPGFTFSAYADELLSTMLSIDDAANTILTPSLNDDALPHVGTNMMTWADGTHLQIGITAIGSSSFTMDGMHLGAGDGSFFSLQGGGRIAVNATGDLTSSSLRVTRMMFGNDQIGQILDGTGRMSLDTGAVSGRLNSMTFSWLADNPATPALEWQYVTLRGSVKLTGDAFSSDLGTLTGRFTAFEWGTMSTDADGNPSSFSPTTSFSGLKMDAASTLNGLDSSGFNSLMAGLHAGSDVIDGTVGDDFLEASTGNDKVFGEEGDDHIDGGAGNDQLFGGAGNDHIIGGAGNDKIVAGDGANWVEGGAGNDVLRTGAGADVIYGGEGADKINGGGSSDVFVFDNLAVGGKDTINDFNAAEDFLAFDTTVFGSLAGGITDANFVKGKVATDTVHYLIFDEQGGKLYYDADGSDPGAAVQIAVVKGSLTGLDAGNFIDEATLFA